jgi:hypothetical protein
VSSAGGYRLLTDEGAVAVLCDIDDQWESVPLELRHRTIFREGHAMAAHVLRHVWDAP